jgi:SAM-dependent methyltransferase
MIERARKHAASRRSGAEYQLAAAEALPFGDDVFDVVVSRLVFHHLIGDLQAQALTEISRVLRPGGRLVVADMASHALTRGHHLGARGSGSDPENKISLEQAISGAGFTGVKSTRLMYGQIIAVTGNNPEG